jgi:hypothetical protein
LVILLYTVKNTFLLYFDYVKEKANF